MSLCTYISFDPVYVSDCLWGILAYFLVLLEAICRKGHERPRFLYVWRHRAGLSPCTVTCGTYGTATKRAQCFKVMSVVAKTSKGNQVEDSFCDQALRPRDLVGPCQGLLSFCISCRQLIWLLQYTMNMQLQIYGAGGVILIHDLAKMGLFFV